MNLYVVGKYGVDVGGIKLINMNNKPRARAVYPPGHLPNIQPPRGLADLSCFVPLQPGRISQCGHMNSHWQRKRSDCVSYDRSIMGASKRVNAAPPRRSFLPEWGNREADFQIATRR